MPTINIFWFRRDLRLEDNAGLYHALKSKNPVLPLFIFDKNILEDLEDRTDARVQFIHETISSLNEELAELGSSIIVRYGKPIEVWKKLVKEFEIGEVFTNRDFEPYALERDEAVKTLLEKSKIAFHTFKDHFLFEKNEVLKDDGTPYMVFTPYSRKWKAKLETKLSKDIKGKTVSFYFKAYPNEKYFHHFFQIKKHKLPSLESMDFQPSSIPIPSKTVKQSLIKKYSEQRNFPAIRGTSQLGIHFRFGTISIRQKARAAQKLNETYWNELIWRDFYSMIMSHFPHVVTQPFRAKYDHVEWVNDKAAFKK